ncbi:MAG: MBL fold metallo-hydrolase [Holophaga sp.]|nr:MBL fold metallo-hydrolase [Holophaga sp.]
MTPKFSLQPGKPPRPLSMPKEIHALLQARMDQLHWSTAPMRLGKGIGLTGPIPRRHSEEAVSGPFYLDPEGFDSDPLEDDQAIWVSTPQGLVVLVGCAHAGVANTLDHIRAITKKDSTLAVVGGLHLAAAPNSRIQFTLQTIRDAGVQHIAPVHCTGLPATSFIQEAFGDLGKTLTVGESIEFNTLHESQ